MTIESSYADTPLEPQLPILPMTRDRRIARWISRLTSPPLVAIGGAIFTASEISARGSWYWALFIVCFNILLPSGYILWLSGSLLKRGWSVNASRKTTLLVCALCVVPVVFAARASNLWMATFLIGLAASAHQGWSANLFTLVSDLFPKQAVASVVGLGGMFGSITAMAFAQSAGLILQATGSYWPLFIISGSAYLIALAIIQVLIPDMKPAELERA